MTTVMVVDDEERIRTLLTRSLRQSGHDVVAVASGEAALSHLVSHDVDLVLLDLVLPKTSGMQVLERLRSYPDPPPVIVLSGIHEVATRVEALNHGAVDIVAKPFAMPELLARVSRHLPSNRSVATESRYHDVRSIRFDTHRRMVDVGGRHVALSEREAAVLSHLIRRRGDVVTREELLRETWGLSFDPGSNLVDVCMKRLRAKLGPESPIETVRGVGYCIPAE